MLHAGYQSYVKITVVNLVSLVQKWCVGPSVRMCHCTSLLAVPKHGEIRRQFCVKWCVVKECVWAEVDFASHCSGNTFPGEI
jgi:hypothetical protein